MRDPYISAAKWLASRLLWLLVIIAILVVARLYADESRLLIAELRGLAPDAGLLQTLEHGRAELEQFARDREQEAQRRLDAAASQSSQWIAQRMQRLTQEVADHRARARSPVRRTLALLTGGGFRDDFRNDIEIALLEAEHAALARMQRQVEREHRSLREARQSFERARERILRVYGSYRASQAELGLLEREHPVAIWIPGTDQYRRASELRGRVENLLTDSDRAATQFFAARDELARLTARADATSALLGAGSREVLGPLQELIDAKRDELAAAEERMARVEGAVRAVLLPAVLIVAAVTLSPVAIRAFWYFVVAPVAARRPPVRLLPDAAGELAVPDGGDASGRVVSAVSQALAVDERHEALVLPAYLQSSSVGGRKDTKWLLDWSYPLSSLASGMVALTRIHGTRDDSFVVSSKNDAFSEIGVLGLPDGSAMALQPRCLVGIVQERDRPVRIESHWRLGSLSAWLTLQLRFLVFRGPATLIVQGCRGVRVERAGSGRSIDQAATIGFTANLDYSTNRSETFGAYLMGEHGLFNDNFAGGPGFYVYEEMPYFNRKTGITGRGLEGLTDVLLKAFGI